MLKNGLHSLYTELLTVDPHFGNKVHENDKQRILRGLEVYKATGKPLSSFFEQKSGHESADTVYIGIHDERENLKKRIDIRIDSMFKHGFVEEVKELRSKGFDKSLQSMRSIGYAEVNEYLDGKIGSVDEAKDLMKTSTKKYAKRQMTWFRKNKKIVWFKREELQNIRTYINQYIGLN